MKSEYAVEEEMSHVLAALLPTNRLVMETALTTGLRVSDVLSLKREQIRKGRFTVREKKTGKSRRVYIPNALGERLLRNEADRNSEYVFPGGRSAEKPRTRQAVWADVKHAAKAFRLPQNVTPHTARKVYAVRLMHKYGDLERVRKALGHDRVETTMLYAMADIILTSRRSCGNLETASKSKKGSPRAK